MLHWGSSLSHLFPVESCGVTSGRRHGHPQGCRPTTQGSLSQSSAWLKTGVDIGGISLCHHRGTWKTEWAVFVSKEAV